MEQTLYLFVKSTRPDQYLNPAIHCLEYENVNKIVYTYINDSRESTEKVKDIPLKVRKRVRNLLDSLSEDGMYRYFDSPKEKEPTNLSKYYPPEDVRDIKRFYTRFLTKDVEWEIKVIEYLDLREVLTNICRREKNSIFDVTALDNKHIGDILAVSIVEGFHNIYTFELKDAPNFIEPWKSLFYELHIRKQGEDKYQYINLVKTQVFRDCTKIILIRKLPLKISLLATPLFIIILLLIYFIFGSTNWVIQVVGILSAVASLLSVFLSFFSAKK